MARSDIFALCLSVFDQMYCMYLLGHGVQMVSFHSSGPHRLQLSVIDYFRGQSDLLLIGYITDFQSNITHLHYLYIVGYQHNHSTIPRCVFVVLEKRICLQLLLSSKGWSRVVKMDDDALIHEGQHLRYRHDIKMNALNASIVYSISFI